MGYRELAAVLREQITSGQLAPDARVPSENDLIQRYGLARETVRRAVRVLEAEGLVLVRHGFATRVVRPKERVVVEIELGSTVVVRRATVDERMALDLSVGVHLAVVTNVDGESVTYVADQVIFRSI